MWLGDDPQGDAPSARAASTYSLGFICSTELRMSRAMLGQPNSDEHDARP
jgi:hypothetical protein